MWSYIETERSYLNFILGPAKIPTNSMAGLTGPTSPTNMVKVYEERVGEKV